MKTLISLAHHWPGRRKCSRDGPHCCALSLQAIREGGNLDDVLAIMGEERGLSAPRKGPGFWYSVRRLLAIGAMGSLLIGGCAAANAVDNQGPGFGCGNHAKKHCTLPLNGMARRQGGVT